MMFKSAGSLIIILLLLIPSWSGAQSLPGELTIARGGKIWIEGTAGPVDFNCQAQELSGQGQITNTSDPQSTIRENGKVNISVSLPVHSLDCGKKAMNSDMYSALKAERHPSITYQLLEATLDKEAKADTGSWMPIVTRGIMNIAGVADTTEIVVSGKVLDNDHFQVKGNKMLNMDTYNIDPPSKMFGLIRADKKLDLHFNVTVALRSKSK
ncbi:YceI family protein [Fodinibius saliphilus]|uniref:YceI family protein n=1 Tax=Fodinibius saliphilus TaxID=1920650 RepID=UPI0011099AB5|nr:YceI family protein [Fodinibius saliphilus]